jgi:acid phosphatase (class A)
MAGVFPLSKSKDLRMSSLKGLLLAGGLSVLGALPTWAADPYLTAASVNLIALLPPPPIAGSDTELAEAKAVVQAQTQASDARKEQALADSDESVYQMFMRVLGPNFNPSALPKTTLLFERMGATEGPVVNGAKKAFDRTRPWAAYPEIKYIPKPSGRASYPSGHTTRVAANAIVLSSMVPEKRREIWARAEDYANSRIIGGMHYASDVEAGWRAGTVIATLLFQQDVFNADLAAATAELRAALGLAATASK